MAIYILAGSSDRPTGSRLGCTFQKAGVNFIIRRRTVPKQKRTEKQSAVKNRFDHVTKKWRTLSAAEQTTFDNEVANYPRTDSLGNIYYMRANALQNSSNISLIASGSPPVLSMPAPAIFPGFAVGQLGVELLAQSVNAALLADPVPAGFVLRVSFSDPLTDTRVFTPQTLLPGSDIINPGAWVVTPLWSKINDGSEAQTISSPTGTNPSAAFTIGLTAGVTPNTGTRTITFRVRKNAAGGQARSCRINLLDNLDNLIQQFNTGPLGNTFTTFAFNITNPITDYSNLRIQILDIRSGGGAGRGLVFAWINFSIPSAVAGYENLRYRQIVNYQPSTNTIGVNNWAAWSSFYGNGSSFADRFFIARYELIALATGQASPPLFEVGEILQV